MLTSHDIVCISRLWTLENPAFTAITSGTNNVTYQVDAAGHAYILRVYLTDNDIDRVRFEHRVLESLAPLGLPFAIPTPIPAASGETLVTAELDTQMDHASLFPVIPGEHPDAGDHAEQRACGRALGELDRAFAAVPTTLGPGARAPFGHLDQIDPIVANTHVVVRQLSIESDYIASIAAIVDDLQNHIPPLYTQVPVQVVHRDYDASNVLMQDGRVTGILDFEFAGPDLRVVDLAASLAGFRSHPWQNPHGMDDLLSFAAGYGEVVPLSAGEIEAVPMLMLLRSVVGMLAREARRRHGLAQTADVVSRAREVLRMKAWIESYGDELVQALRGNAMSF